MFKTSPLHEEAQSLFKDKFELDNFEIFIIPGKESIGMEALISSFRYKLVPIGHQEGSLYKWKQLIDKYKKRTSEFNSREEHLYVRLEESSSSVSIFDNVGIVDAISSFPFYSLNNPKSFATCSGKLLKCIPGLNIIGIRKDSIDFFNKDKLNSFLNLTSKPDLLNSFIISIKKFNLKEFKTKIYKNCDTIRESVNRDFIIGDHICPIITIEKEGKYKQIHTYTDSWNIEK